MPGLQRIILVFTHLPGVVELQLDAHANVCGTNASGKTTLQRLVPVFFGELPSKVVPRTRKKFSEFYLPHGNSYLVYEYERENGEICQAVVTRKDADSVQYRFVTGPFESEQLLVEVDGKVQAMKQEQWLKQLKQLGLEYSSKLQSTSEFRSIIQNDPAVGRANSRENTKLRQLAARYSLVAPEHRIRHMEKLVSAVHAKEGKMDTLRTMLAAIFEEDGLVQPTTTVRNVKAREWITQMRQTKRLTGLHEQYQELENQGKKLDQLELQLAQLKPQLNEDLQTLKTQKADQQEALQKVKAQLDGEKREFERQQDDLNGKISAANQELKTVSGQLDSIQAKYDKYLDSDMDQLEKDMRNLPLWREQLDEQQEQYRILIEQHKDLESQLLHQKNKLSESLERLRVKNHNKARDINSEKSAKLKAQQAKESELRGQYEKRREQQTEQFEHSISELNERIVSLKHDAAHAQLNSRELDNLALADKRVELAQRDWQSVSKKMSEAEKALQQVRRKRDDADLALTEQRRLVRTAKEQLNKLTQQLNPEQGSLRQYLRDNMPGWEGNLGRIIDESLLQRTDLSPEYAGEQDSVFGLTMDLNTLPLPEYAQQEDDIRRRLHQAHEQLDTQEQGQVAAEAHLHQLHQEADVAREALAEIERKFEQADQEVRYASDAKTRLQQEHKNLLEARQRHAQNELDLANTQKAERLAQKAQDLQQLKSDFDEQLLEFRSGWQEEIALFDEQLAELETQVDEKREQNRAQIKQLEDAFAAELASKDIDPKTLAALKQQIETRSRQIQSVNGRRDELNDYHDFIQITWQTRRPQLLEDEAKFKAELQTLNQHNDEVNTAYQKVKNTLTQQAKDCEKAITHAGGLIAEIEPNVKQVNLLDLPLEWDGLPELQGDLSERIGRCSEALEVRNRTEVKFKGQLNDFENVLGKDAGKDFIDTMQHEFGRLEENADSRERLPILDKLIRILESKAKQIVEQGETIGGDLANFFKVFSDINRKIASQSKRLTDEVGDDLKLDGITRSEVKILSTVDELNFWEPLQRFAKAWQAWRTSGEEMPQDDYLDSLADVVEVLPNGASYSIESLLRLELHLNEGGSDLVIRNDRQLLESSSHGMAYLILCKFLLAFTRLLRNQADIAIHWPIDEIGTLAYHNVEKLFKACQSNKINILGAFPNPESEVLMLFKHRYLIDKQKQELQRIEPKVSRISQRLQASKLKETQA